MSIACTRAAMTVSIVSISSHKRSSCSLSCRTINRRVWTTPSAYGSVERVAIADTPPARQRAALLGVARIDLEHLRVQLVDQPRPLRHEVVAMVAQQAQLGADIIPLDKGTVHNAMPKLLKVSI